MFKNRSVLVKMVDDPKPTTSEKRWFDIDYKEVNKQATRSIATLVGAYILADTSRKAVIHIVETKIR